MDNADHDTLIERALGGDEEALATAFTHYRPRLRTMVALRLHPRLQRRIDASDVLQDAFVELSRQLPEFSKKRDLPFFLWLRLVTGQRLAHIGFFIASENEVDDWYAFLKDSGVEIKAAPKTHRDGARSFYCSDPEGVIVQIIFHPPICR